MSDRSQWKMLHLLYVCGKPSLSLEQLENAGINCYHDTVSMLVDGGAVIREGDDLKTYSLSQSARAILSTCLVANRRLGSPDLWVDYPRAFVIMPFGESWSDCVYEQLMKPAIEGAGLECVRGDTSIRVGDLTSNIWSSILSSGIIVGDVSAVNANVFYELGLAHALGKDTFILKRKGAVIPADFAGAHYYEYELEDLEAAKRLLLEELERWASDRDIKSQSVKALY